MRGFGTVILGLVLVLPLPAAAPPPAADDPPLVPATPHTSADEDLLILPPLVGEARQSATAVPAARPGATILADLCFAESTAPAQEEVAPEEVFWCGRLLFEANVGAYFSQRGLGPTTPSFDFLPINLRLGMVLNDPDFFPGCTRGSFEGLIELSTAPVIWGFGNIAVGPTALLRYNWAQPDCRLVPYLQGGAGFVYTDAYRDWSQRAIGQSFEFALKAAAGLHYFVNRSWSIDVEGGYTHISNADLASRNLGINALGGSVGVTYYFPCAHP